MKFRKAVDVKPNTWCGESMLAYRSDEVLFLYWSVSSISHPQRHWRKMGGKESKQELNSCVWGLECLITLTSVNGYKKNNDVTLPYSKLRELGL